MGTASQAAKLYNAYCCMRDAADIINSGFIFFEFRADAITELVSRE